MLVIGVGNAYRGDDAVGLVVAERLSALAPPAVEVIGHPGDPVSLMDSWDRRHVFLVDAVTAGGAAGTVHRLDLLAAPVPASLGHRGTHGAGVAEAVELARALDRLPARLICYGIEGGSFTVGAGLSPAVRDAVTEVCHQLLAELGHADDRA